MTYRIISVISVALLAVSTLAQETELSLEANRRELYLGESFILRATVSGPGRSTEPDLSGIRNCRIEPLGSQEINYYRMRIENGRMQEEDVSSCISSYRLTPLSAGRIQAGPVSIKFKGESISSQGPTLSVTDIQKQDMVKLGIYASSDTVLVDEPFKVTLTILIRALEGKYASTQPLFPDNPPNIDIPYLARIPGLEGPDINRILSERVVGSRNQAGIAINNIAQNIRALDFFSGLSGMFGEARKVKFALHSGTREKNGKSYFLYLLELPFIPVQEGDYVFGPTVFKGLIPAEIEESGRAKPAEIFAVGSACTVRVVPPPSEGRPLSFNGAIGKQLEARAELDALTCNVGDPLKLTITLGGEVRVGNMMPPRLSLQTNLLDQFTIYDNTAETVRQDGLVQYVYTLRPNAPGRQELPPIEFSFYNTEKRCYQTIATEPIPLQIDKATEVTATKIVGQPNKDQQKEKPKPVLSPTRLDPAGAEPDSLTGNPLVIGLLAAAGPSFYVVAVLGQFIAANRSKWRNSSRRHNAAARALARLKRARSLAGSDTTRARHEICAILRGYVNDRLHQRSAAFTPRDFRETLIEAGLNEEDAEQFSSLFEQAFNSGFCSSASESEIGSLFTAIEELIPRMKFEPMPEQESAFQFRTEASISQRKLT